MISGAVAGVDFRNTGGADPFGEGKDLCVGLIVEVEAADQAFTFLSGKVAVTSRIMVSAPPWEQLLKITRPSGVSKTRLAHGRRNPVSSAVFPSGTCAPGFLFSPVPESYVESDKPRHMGKTPRRRA